MSDLPDDFVPDDAYEIGEPDSLKGTFIERLAQQAKRIAELEAELEAAIISNKLKDDVIETRGAENERLREQYCDLIYQVEQKYDGESRHETAKRYICQREQSRSEGADKAALKGEQ